MTVSDVDLALFFLRFIRKIFCKNTKNNLKYYKIYF